MKISYPSKFEYLLQETGNILQHDHANQASTAYRFSIFNILKIGHYEVRTHSPILAELLDPNGTHGQGDFFLRSFLDKFELRDFPSKGVKVRTEANLGKARLDILISTENGDKEIVVENKIYARTYIGQLETYRNIKPNARLIYLTLKGDTPPGDGTEESHKFATNIISASYKNDIIDWLTSCQKAKTRDGRKIPDIINDFISTYIILIKQLTSQYMNPISKEVITLVTKDRESYLAYMELCENQDLVLKEVSDRIDKRLNKVAERLRCQRANQSGASWFMENEELKKHHICFGFEPQKLKYSEICFGFKYSNNDKKSQLSEYLQKNASDSIGVAFNTSEWWPAWSWCNHANWGKDEFSQILFGDFLNTLDALFTDLYSIAEKSLEQNKKNRPNI